MPDVTVRLSYVQRAMIGFIAQRGGRCLFRFGVTEADLAAGKTPEQRAALQEQKEIADREIRALGETTMALLTITKIEIPDPDGRDHELSFTDAGRSVASQILPG